MSGKLGTVNTLTNNHKLTLVLALWDHLSEVPVLFDIVFQLKKDTGEWFGTQYAGARD